MKPKYSIIIPVYNEEEVIKASYSELKKVMDSCNESYELVFVNDGSIDSSAKIIAGLCKEDSNIRLINFSRNFGHQPAITAGMDYAQGDAVVVIDSDLQDPPEVILQMISKWKEGFHVVYGKRLKREGETYFKKTSAKIYYRLLNKMTNVDMPVDTGDFRLIDKKVCDSMKNLNEKNRYIRGLVSWVGYNQTYVEYTRHERFAGETKYPLRKMLKFAMDGITAFSYKPLKLTTNIGFIISLVSFIHLMYVLYEGLFNYNTVDGWASTISVILFTQGIILMMLGIMGEYIGRIFEETKNRPIYLVQETLGYNNEDKNVKSD